MNTDRDEGPDLQRSVNSKLLLKGETEKMIGFAFEVLNEVGHGLNEKIVILSPVIRVHPWLNPLLSCNTANFLL